MKKKFPLVLLIFIGFTFSLNSQKIERKTRKRVYLKISDYKKKYPNKPIEFVKGNYQIFENDTLILIDNEEFSNRISVPYEVKDSTFLEIYKDVVYMKYIKPQAKFKTKMKLWKDEIKIFFPKKTDKKIKKSLIKFSKTLSKEVDSLKISVVKNIEDSNYIIYQLDDKNNFKYEPKIKDSIIGYYTYWNNKGELNNCRLQIDLRKYKSLDKAIELAKNYFFRSLGYFSSTRLLDKEALLSYKYASNKKITEIDLEILKYHYSYGICKFTDLKTFEENHKRAKATLKKGHKAMFSHHY